QGADHRRLARPVRPEEAERAASRHEQVHAVDRGARAEALGQAPRLDRGRAVVRARLCLGGHRTPSGGGGELTLAEGTPAHNRGLPLVGGGGSAFITRTVISYHVVTSRS